VSVEMMKLLIVRYIFLLGGESDVDGYSRGFFEEAAAEG
jgi:hypothetical protein